MITPAEKKNHRQKTSKPLMWVSVVSITMIFAGLTSGYVVVQGDAFWVQAPLPKMFWFSTFNIILSSISYWLAQKNLQASNHSLFKSLMFATLLFGLSFSITQYLAWKEMTETGNFFRGNLSDLKGKEGIDYAIKFRGNDLIKVNGEYYASFDVELSTPLTKSMERAFNVSSGFKYVLSGLHLAHVVAGLIMLIILNINAFAGKYTNSDKLGIEVGAIYWHFLGILWIYLFAFLSYIR